MPTSLDWLTARPIAHRGLHDAAHGIIENTAGAVRAAIAANYGIEVDVQVSRDGEAMVHHDDVLGRLTDGEGRLDSFTAAELKRVPFRGSDERMMTLGELCDLVGGRVTMLVELKSRFDGDARLPAAGRRGARRLSRPGGADVVRPAAARAGCGKNPLACLRGIVAAKYRPHPYWDLMPAWMRHGMGYLLTALTARPQFVAYAVADLPALAPLFARHVFGLPLLTWAVRTEAERRACRTLGRPDDL